MREQKESCMMKYNTAHSTQASPHRILRPVGTVSEERWDPRERPVTWKTGKERVDSALSAP